MSTSNKSANIEKIKIFSGPNVGVHLVASSEFVLAPEGIKQAILDTIERTMEVPVHSIPANTNLFGALTLVNKHGIVLSTVLGLDTVEHLEALDIGKVAQVPKNFFALGNSAVTNDIKTMISPFIDKDSRKIIKDTLKTEMTVMKLGGSVLLGSLVAANENGAIVSDLVNEDELDLIKEVLGIKKVGYSTINKGFYFPSSGIIANENGCILGDDVTGIEIMKIMNILFS